MAIVPKCVRAGSPAFLHFLSNFTRAPILGKFSQKNLVDIQQQDLVDVRAAEVERLLANSFHRHTVGENTDPPTSSAAPPRQSRW
jgi:hypothetical protein